MNGILVVNKPVGWTSRDVVNVVCKKLGTKKVGHTGTLDPLASGVLVLVIGRYTKLGNMLSATKKEYIASIKLGILTDTLDITGNILENKPYKISKDNIINIFKKYIGKYHMEVPLYSAKKINGKRLYKYARNKIDVILPYQDVYIDYLELINFKEDIIDFKTVVSKGTYIRSLIKDICNDLNTVGVMNSLIRTKQGIFSIDNAYTLDDIKSDNFKLLSLKEIIDVDTREVNTTTFLKIKNGNEIKIDSKKEYILFTYKGEEIALYKYYNNNIYKCYIMLKI